MTRAAPPRRFAGALAVLALAVLPAASADARLGDPDPSFGGGDGVLEIGPGTGLRAVALDGGEIVGGGYTGTPADSMLVRVTATGVPTGLGGDGIAAWDSGAAAEVVDDVVVDDVDGSVVAAGSAAGTPAALSDAPGLRLARIAPSGTVTPLSPDVLPGGVSAIRGIALLPDRRIVVTGWSKVSSTALTRRMFVGVLQPGDGQPDPAFAGGYALVEGAEGHDVFVDGAGRIIVVGQSESASGTVAAAWRYSAATGDPDLAFNATGQRLVDYDEIAAGGDRFLGAVPRAGGLLAAGTLAGGPRGLVQAFTEGGGFDPGYGESPVEGSSDWAGSGEAIATTSVGGAFVAGRLARALQTTWLTPAGRLDAAGGGSRTFAQIALGTGRPGVALAGGDAATVVGETATGQGFIARAAPNAAPAAALTAPAELVAGAPAEITAAGSNDPEGETLTYAFDLDGNGSFEFDGGDNPLALRSFGVPGTYTVGVRVRDPRGGTGTAQRQIAVTAGPVVPQPVLGEQGVARPVRGIVRYRLPGQKRFRRMVELTAIPNGTEIDTRKGRVLLTVLHDASGALDGARFYAGRFIFRQGQGAVPVTRLKLTNGTLSKCRKRKGGGAKAGASTAGVVAVAARIPRSSGNRRLWGNGRGKFRTRGRYGAATVRGTKWLTDDRCDGTLVRVKRGRVDVKDLQRPRRKAVQLTAGEELFVKKRGA